ncbi:DUF222 domain-containing protein [Tersicoccus sp. MR15.9]|uniref:HNH endonuclease signature motif containing protein n=1 Tax=Tersicoccus mangrovi TaxID=3121635 RepID=UPI002FE695F1
MEAPTAPTTRPLDGAVTPVLPGLVDTVMAVAAAASSAPCAASTGHGADPTSWVARLTGARDAEVGLEQTIGALEDVRRLESWATATKHRLVLTAMDAARAEHEWWIDGHPHAFDDADAPGLPRAERLAIADRSGIAEIAGVLHLSEAAVHTLLLQAGQLTEHLPSTAAALEAGTITAKAAIHIADATTEYADLLASSGTDPRTTARFTQAITVTETVLLDGAVSGRTPSWLRDRARRLRDLHHPQSFEQRERAARACRYVRIMPDRDGMAHLTALLPAATAWCIDQRLTALARQHRELDQDGTGGRTNDDGVCVGDNRTEGTPAGGAEPVGEEPARPTVAQLRADVLAGLLAGCGATSPPVGSRDGAPHEDAGTAPRVLLTVGAETLLGGNRPGVLGAFGPIPAAAARELAARATSFMLGVTAALDASQGWNGSIDARVLPVVATDSGQYRIPAALRRALAVRDGTCRFPGCRRNAAGCDLDHVVAWVDGGATTAENLAHLCRRHHVLKHHSGWTVTMAAPHTGPPGESATTVHGYGQVTARSAPEAASTHRGEQYASGHLVWTSPAGRRYATEPDGVEIDGPAPF